MKLRANAINTVQYTAIAMRWSLYFNKTNTIPPHYRTCEVSKRKATSPFRTLNMSPKDRRLNCSQMSHSLLAWISNVAELLQQL